MIVTRSAAGASETVDRLIAAIEDRGLTVFARIDHAAAARDAGLELPPEEVVLFGNPRAGTPLMQTDPRVGIELPLRVLVWQSGDGETMLGYRDPRDLTAQYDVAEHEVTLGRMAALLGELASEAAGR
ncbi:MAG: hypothetical protein QOF37_2622 [Thermoleophilaceae bacterium]|nr:hypothetical protein [Thermoleophilaceae bacterium]